MSDFDDPSLDARPGKYYVDQDSDVDGPDTPDIVYADGSTFHDNAMKRLDRLGFPSRPPKPLTGRNRIP